MSASLVEVMATLSRAGSESASLRDLLEGDGIFPWRLPENKPLNYITFPVPSEGPFPLVFNKQLTEGDLQISIWSFDPEVVGKIWQVLFDLYNDVTFLIVAGKSVSGTLRLIHILKDPHDDELYQGVVRYEWSTWTM